MRVPHEHDAGTRTASPTIAPGPVGCRDVMRAIRGVPRVHQDRSMPSNRGHGQGPARHRSPSPTSPAAGTDRCDARATLVPVESSSSAVLEGHGGRRRGKRTRLRSPASRFRDRALHSATSPPRPKRQAGHPARSHPGLVAQSGRIATSTFARREGHPRACPIVSHR